MGVAPSASAMRRKAPVAWRMPARTAAPLPRLASRLTSSTAGTAAPLLPHAGGSVVGAPVVHHQDLVRLVAPVAAAHHLSEIAREAVRLVVGGNHHGPAEDGGRRHARRLRNQEALSARAPWRATPVFWAARTTSRATAGATFLLNTLGMMYSGPSSDLPTHDAMARAAASFISSCHARARASSEPAEEAREAQDIVDLVGVVGPAGGHARARGLGRLRRDLRGRGSPWRRRWRSRAMDLRRPSPSARPARSAR